jgi:hypothetical protein
MSKTIFSLHIIWRIIEKTLEGLTTRKLLNTLASIKKLKKNFLISKTAVGRVRQYLEKMDVYLYQVDHEFSILMT